MNFHCIWISAHSCILQLTEGMIITYVYHVKVVETELGSIKANQRIFWSELMTLLKDQQSSIILKKVNKMGFTHFSFTDCNLTKTGSVPNTRSIERYVLTSLDSSFSSCMGNYQGTKKKDKNMASDEDKKGQKSDRIKKLSISLSHTLSSFSTITFVRTAV